MSTFRKLLLSLLLVSLTGSAFGAGTFASFTASTTNANSTFASGTIVLSNDVAGGTGVCLSSGSDSIIGNGGVSDPDEDELAPNAGNCDALFDGLTAHKPGDAPTVNLTLANEGNVGALTGLTGEAMACVNGNVSDGITEYHGTGDLCSYLEVTVQEMQSDFTTAVHCLYDADGANTGACGAGGTIDAFATATGTTPMTFNAAAVGAAGAADDTRYVVIGLNFPDGGAGAENIYMGRTATFGIEWTLTQ